MGFGFSANSAIAKRSEQGAICRQRDWPLGQAD